MSNERTTTLNADVWRLWVREYGAADAIHLARSHGYESDEIRRVNREVMNAARRAEAVANDKKEPA